MGDNSRTAIVKKNIIASFFIKGCSIIISLLLVPLTLDYISSELYGIWLTLSSIVLWLNFFDIGFTLGLKNKLAEAIALKKWEYGKSLVSTTYFVMLLVFIPLCLLGIVLIPLIDWPTLLNVSSVYRIEINKALYVLLICFCAQMIVNVLATVVTACQKVALASLFPVLGNFLSLVVIYLLIQYSQSSLYILALSISLMPVIVLIIASFVLYRRKLRLISPSISSINKVYIKDLWGLGSKFFFMQIQVIVLYQCTNFLISNISGPESVTSYNIAYKYLGVAMMIYTIILSPLWPAFTDAFVRKDYSWMKNVYRKMTLIYVISVVILLFMILVAPYVYDLWIGKKANVSWGMTLAVAIYMMIHSWDTLQVQLINGIGTIKLQTYVTFIGLILHIPLSVFLGKYIGDIGAVCSMILINILYSLIFTIQIRKILNKKASGIWME